MVNYLSNDFVCPTCPCMYAVCILMLPFCTFFHDFQRMGAGRKTETFYAATPSAQTQNRSNEWYGAFSVAARNLREDELGGVIFGCKHNTMNECLSKQLFG